jgi:hypothetical protein
MMSCSPLGIGVTVGYHRSVCMSSPSAHRPAVGPVGVNVWVSRMPSNWGERLPPARKTVPSLRWPRPAQKMLKPVLLQRGCSIVPVNVSVAGSQIVYRER